MSNSVFLLGGGLNGLAVARSLGRYSIPVYLFGVKPDDIACRSRYVTKVDYSDPNDHSQLIEQLRKTAQTFRQKPALLYISDTFLEMCSDYRNELDEYFCLNLPSAASVHSVIDKGEFGHFCARQNLPAPKSWAPESQVDIEQCSNQARFPVVIKPIFSHGTAQKEFKDNGTFAKMVLVSEPEELNRYYSAFIDIGIRLIVQEYIDGPDNEHYSYCSYRTSSSKELVSFGFRKLRIHPIHGGVGTFAEAYNEPDLVGPAREVLDELQFKGVSSVCFKRDIRTGQMMLHEVNGRFPMGHSAGLLCGIDVPYVAYLDVTGTSVPTNLLQRTPGQGKWILLGTDINSFRAYRAANEITIWQWLKSLLQVRRCAEFASDDLRPFNFFMISLISRAWRKMIGATSKGQDQDANTLKPGKK